MFCLVFVTSDYIVYFCIISIKQDFSVMGISNAHIHGIPLHLARRLQSVMNAAA